MTVSLAEVFRRRVRAVESGYFPSTRRQNWWRREDGSTLIEFAVTLPTLFALIFVFIEICLMLYTYEMISECARQGTRYAMVRGDSCPSAATPTCEVNAAAVNAYVSGLKWPNVGGGTVTPATTYPDGNETKGSHVQVKVTYTYHLLLPFVPNNSFTLSSTSKKTIIQ
ncbi:MAG: pilus assembly protein [Acidobacteriota bacterium]|nr:pilus assembly protein [Acidobacteriota bacterium]